MLRILKRKERFGRRGELGLWEFFWTGGRDSAHGWAWIRCSTRAPEKGLGAHGRDTCLTEAKKEGGVCVDSFVNLGAGSCTWEPAVSGFLCKGVEVEGGEGSSQKHQGRNLGRQEEQKRPWSLHLIMSLPEM